jgi:hypothetical protein
VTKARQKFLVRYHVVIQANDYVSRGNGETSIAAGRGAWLAAAHELDLDAAGTRTFDQARIDGFVSIVDHYDFIRPKGLGAEAFHQPSELSGTVVSRYDNGNLQPHLNIRLKEAAFLAAEVRMILRCSSEKNHLEKRQNGRIASHMGPASQ